MSRLLKMTLGLLLLTGICSGILPSASAQVDTLTDLHLFSPVSSAQSNSDGAYPYAGLVRGRDGSFYGTTTMGGVNGSGAIFKIAPDGTFTTLYSFSAVTIIITYDYTTVTNSDGAYPYAGLVQGPDGDFYGTTWEGGVIGTGTIFKITLAGAFTVLHTFNGDGAYSMAPLTLGPDGYFYGTTFWGPNNSYGTVFKIAPGGAFTSLLTFTGYPNPGENPNDPLVLGSDGNFYGTTLIGGNNGDGVIFKMTPAGSLTVLVNLGPFNFGVFTSVLSHVSLVQGRDGNFYGTDSRGGAHNNGYVFQMTPSGAFTVLHDFSTTGNQRYPTNTDGAVPSSPLIQGPDGSFYGTASEGGANGSGTVFRITPTGIFNTIHDFDAQSASGDNTEGANPFSGLLLSYGNLYGTTTKGGPNGTGTIYRINTRLTYPPFDLNGDGQSDLLFQNVVNGDVVYTLMNGAASTSWGTFFKGVDPQWQIVGTPDLNGDGHPDILWENQALGQVVYTLLNGTTQLSWGKLFTGISSGCRLVGTPDLNGDGIPDILWQNTGTGEVDYTLMNGTTQLSWGKLFTGIPSGWQIVGTPDINGDGYPDILWQNTKSGQLVYTALQGVQVLSWSSLFNVPASYPVVGLADFNGDGYTDFLYQDQAQGKGVISYMDGSRVIDWANLFAGMDPNWKLVAPH